MEPSIGRRGSMLMFAPRCVATASGKNVNLRSDLSRCLLRRGRSRKACWVKNSENARHPRWGSPKPRCGISGNRATWRSARYSFSNVYISLSDGTAGRGKAVPRPRSRATTCPRLGCSVRCPRTSLGGAVLRRTKSHDLALRRRPWRGLLIKTFLRTGQSSAPKVTHHNLEYAAPWADAATKQRETMFADAGHTKPLAYRLGRREVLGAHQQVGGLQVCMHNSV